MGMYMLIGKRNINVKLLKNINLHFHVDNHQLSKNNTKTFKNKEDTWRILFFPFYLTVNSKFSSGQVF